MRTFLAIVGLLLLLILGSQTVRHGFWRWVATHRSVLEPYAEPTEKQIAESKSLEELVDLYAVAHRKVEEESKTETSQSENEFERRQREPYKSEELLKNAVETWESHQRQIYEVQFLWWSGALFVAAGAFVIRRVEWWLGLSLMIVGFLEMSYATCPPFSLGGSPEEFKRLLTYKLSYSAAALAMLLLAWWYVYQLLPTRIPSRQLA